MSFSRDLTLLAIVLSPRSNVEMNRIRYKKGTNGRKKREEKRKKGEKKKSEEEGTVLAHSSYTIEKET